MEKTLGCYSSLIEAFSGVHLSPARLKEMTALDLILLIGPNNIVFKYVESNE